ncbi:MAG: hypothetical protein M3Y13_08570, partial [Armatimonadota bacterium]|nr:hypothetical protein [Armatimonadota bacterium]
MPKFGFLTCAALLSFALYGLPAAHAQATKTLLSVNVDAGKRIAPTSHQVTVARSQDLAAPGLVVTILPGPEGYPGINIKPEGAVWNLMPYGHVEARVVNVGAKPLYLSLRVDNTGDWHDNPWNTESAFLPPGKSGTVTTIFGRSYG